MHICEYTYEFVKGFEGVELQLTAHWKDRELMMYRETQEGKCYTRNLYMSIYGGYGVSFPGEHHRYYGFTELEEWCANNPRPLSVGRTLRESELQWLKDNLGDFKYTLEKWAKVERISPMAVMSTYWIWKEHPEIEFLIAKGFFALAYSKAFYSRSQKQKSKILKILKNCDFDISLKEAETMIRHGIDHAEFCRYDKDLSAWYCRGKFTYPEWKYLKNYFQKNKISENGINGVLDTYLDLKRMIKDLGRSKDDYWHYPSSIRERHDKALEDLRALKEFKAKSERAKKQKAYFEAVRPYAELSAVIDGYRIEIPQNLLLWDLQAEKLNQCICYCHYDDKVIRGECLLVFITKDGAPEATAELYKSGKVGQFYADEHAKEIHPSEKVKMAFEKWKTMFLKKQKELQKETA